MVKTYIGPKGYRRFSGSGKAVHRAVARKKIGRRIRSNEVVHHKNRNKRDNRPSNLKVISRSKHASIHL